MQQPDWLPGTELPEGSMVTACLVVVSYLDSDGSMCYGVATRGESPMTSYLGLTVLAQQRLMEWTGEDE